MQPFSRERPGSHHLSYLSRFNIEGREEIYIKSVDCVEQIKKGGKRCTFFKRIL